MWGYLSLVPISLTLWASAGVWLVFAIAVINRDVDLTKDFPFISKCGSFPPQSCIFSQVLNIGAAMVVWICIVRYYQLRDWGVKTWPNQLILWSGILCALGTSVAGNFQIILCWWVKGLPQPGAPWMAWLRLGLCSLCTMLMVAMLVLYSSRLRSASAAFEWAVAMLLFLLFGLFAVDFSVLEGCTLSLQPLRSLTPRPSASPGLHSLPLASPPPRP
ncbi:modulator of macroautophagy TMEM150B isoform X2 [Dipodomys merriami]|uniref:modulator of macroautophagy TMEM150B isoform X2 n=1 Tax=Dipodomys merriami TaxID=94247 RepID=UPI003855A4A0